MRFLKAVPDLGPCEGRWVTAFGVPRGCSNRASESFDSPCGHVHRLCATCVYALQRGIGSWDETEDLLQFGMPSNRGSTSGREGAAFWGPPPSAATARLPVRGGPVHRRYAERVPLHVVFAGVCALAALIVVGLPGHVVTGPMAVGTAALLYVLALRHTLHR